MDSTTKETYYAQQNVNLLKNEWGEGQVFISNGSPHSRGCIILVRSGIDISINDTEIDNDGRFIIMNTTISNEEVNIMQCLRP